MVSSAATRVQTQIEVLLPADIRRMQPWWERDFNLQQMEQVVAAYPGRSVWSPESREVVVVGPWRHRPEIASIVGMQAIRYLRELMHAAVDRSMMLGAEAILVLEWNDRQHPSFYQKLGLEMLDAVIPFEVDSARAGPASNDAGDLVRIEPHDHRGLAQLISVDHAAFSWLWINSEAEFVNYFETPGVELWGHVRDGQLVSYIGFTYFGEWGHIDRVAVHPGAQRQGLGRELTLVAMHRLRKRGTRMVGLSTQNGNWKSQRLYHQLGFTRTAQNAYRVYGRRFERG